MQLVILLNLVWVMDSVLFAVFARPLLGLSPSGMGLAFVLAQAALVLGFALLQALALQRAGLARPLAAPQVT